jgi:hypothetical protein
MRFEFCHGPGGTNVSGRRPRIKGYFAAFRLIVGAVMSLAWRVKIDPDHGSEMVHPAARGFIGYQDSTPSQQILDVA